MMANIAGRERPMRTFILSAALASAAVVCAGQASAQSYRDYHAYPAAWGWGDGNAYQSFEDCEKARRNKTVAGAVIGGVVGGVLGRSVAAENAKNEGTAVGAAAGAVVGGAIGRSQAKCNRVADYRYDRSYGGPVYRDSGFRNIEYRYPDDEDFGYSYDDFRDARYGRGRGQQCGWGEALVTDPNGRVIRREPVEFCRNGGRGKWRVVDD